MKITQNSVVSLKYTLANNQTGEKIEETKLSLLNPIESSGLQTETQLVAQQVFATQDRQEDKTHQSGVTLQLLSKPKISKTLLKKVSITAEPLPQEPKDFVIETKSSKRAIVEAVSAVNQAQVMTSISLEPNKEIEHTETSNFTLERRKQSLSLWSICPVFRVLPSSQL